MATQVVDQAQKPKISPRMLVEEYVQYKTSRLHGRSVANANWVTTLAHPCRAYAVYMRTVPSEQRRQLKGSLGMVFSEGDDQARAIKRDLLDMGWEVEGAEGQMAWSKYQITGRQDLKLRKIGFGESVHAEIKSCAPYSYEKLNTVEDLKNHRYYFIQKWYFQVCLYMVLKGVDRYWMILKNKSNGQIKVIEFTLGAEELEAAESMLKKAEETNQFVQIGKMPTVEMKISSPDLCTDCEFYEVCMPELNFGLAAQVLDEEMAADLSAKTDRREELKPAAKEFEELDEELKEEIKSLTTDGQDDVVYGDWMAHVKRIPVKPQEARLVPAKPASVQQRISFVRSLSSPKAP